jgi:3-hydroxy-9,10-secoandrosta-1,3,5(10)-triene-9,17-dione monooxygenase
MIEVSKGHPAVGWCLTLAASHPLLVGSHWGEQAQRELLGAGTYFAAPHSATPQGTCKVVEGGYRISGIWRYSSGIPHATHLVGTTLIFDDKGAHPVLFVVPREKLTILDDWGGDRTLGMQASGSNSVQIDEVFLPAHHVIPFPSFFAKPEDMRDGTPGTRLHHNPMYLGRVAGQYHLSLVIPVIGAAFAAIDEFAAMQGKPASVFYFDQKAGDHFDFQRALGEAIALTDAAEAIAIAAAEKYGDQCRRWAKEGKPITVEENLRLWGQVQHAGRLACEAVEQLLHKAGPSATRKGTRLLRYFRDVTMYRTHQSSQRDAFGTFIGRVHLGRPVGVLDL